MTRERVLLEQLIKSWAQDHTDNFIIADSSADIPLVEGHLTWLIKESQVRLDLLSLVDRLEIFLDNRRKRKYLDGMFCKKCKSFYDFAESNQEDGFLLCFSCRTYF